MQNNNHNPFSRLFRRKGKDEKPDPLALPDSDFRREQFKTIESIIPELDLRPIYHYTTAYFNTVIEGKAPIPSGAFDPHNSAILLERFALIRDEQIKAFRSEQSYQRRDALDWIERSLIARVEALTEADEALRKEVEAVDEDIRFSRELLQKKSAARASRMDRSIAAENEWEVKQ